MYYVYKIPDSTTREIKLNVLTFLFICSSSHSNIKLLIGYCKFTESVLKHLCRKKKMRAQRYIHTLNARRMSCIWQSPRPWSRTADACHHRTAIQGVRDREPCCRQV